MSGSSTINPYSIKRYYGVPLGCVNTATIKASNDLAGENGVTIVNLGAYEITYSSNDVRSWNNTK